MLPNFHTLLILLKRGENFRMDAGCELNLPSVFLPGVALLVSPICPSWPWAAVLPRCSCCLSASPGQQQTKHSSAVGVCRPLWQMDTQSLMDPKHQGTPAVAAHLESLTLPIHPLPSPYLRLHPHGARIFSIHWPLRILQRWGNSSSDGDQKTSPEDEFHIPWSWTIPLRPRKNYILNRWLLSEGREMQARAC